MRSVLLIGERGDPESEAAAAWWQIHSALPAQPPCVEPSEVTEDALRHARLVWYHARSAAPVPTLASDWVRQGGRALLTLGAVSAADSFGAPQHEITMQTGEPWVNAEDPLWMEGFRDWPDYPHIRGLQGFGEHPLFDGMVNGAFTWRATEGERVWRATSRKPHWPEGAGVVAVERAYVHLETEEAVAWEYAVGAGWLLCIGANVCLTMRDSLYQPQRDRLLANAIRYLDAEPARSTRTYWPTGATHAAVGVLRAPGRDFVNIAMPALHSVVSDARVEGLGREWIAAGERALLVGNTVRGLQECWLYPLCVVSGDVRRDGLHAQHARITDGDVTTRLADERGAPWTERWAVSSEEAAVWCQVTAPVGDATVVYRLALPLRLQWPMPPDLLQPVRAERVDGTDGCRIALTANDRKHRVVLDVAGADDVRLTEDSAVSVLEIAPGAGRTTTIRIALLEPTSSRRAQFWSAATVARERPEMPELRLPESSLVSAFELGARRLAAFSARVGGQRGLLAGFARSRPGWSVSRPGYAWFFGRDACWCVDALVSSGQFALARDAIAWLGARADITGKIPHEVTLSGVAHYDAADATPLWLRAVCAYAEWTGNLDAVVGWLPAIRRAFDFVRATDRDGDGLPENTDVGHGWVESGVLGGGAVTSYVAALWCDATRRLARLARALGEDAFASTVQAANESAMEGLLGLRDAHEGRLALHRDRDGQRLDTLTALSAVPVLLKCERPSVGREIVEALNTPRFSAPWGLRMLPTDDVHYKPRAYHAGAVWPLFTGWAALAAFSCRQGAIGLEFLRRNAAVAGLGVPGGAPEVLDGDTGEVAGVCPDQAWSAAMLVTPVVQGLFGVHPCAYEGRVEITSYLPSTWPGMTLSGLRVGHETLEIAVTRQHDSSVNITAERRSNVGQAPPLHFIVEAHG